MAVATTIATTFTAHFVSSHPGSSPLGAAALTHGFQEAFYVLAGIAAFGAVLAAFMLEGRSAHRSVGFSDDVVAELEAA